MSLLPNIPLIIEHIVGFLDYQYLIDLARVNLTFRDVCKQSFNGLASHQRSDFRVFTFHRDELKAYEFKDHCREGHLIVCKWLTTRFHLTAADARVCDNWAFRKACGNGHLDIVQWLTTQFHLTRNDAIADYNEALRMTCMNGDLVLVQWLVNKFNLTIGSMRLTLFESALELACGKGHLSVVKWLDDKFHLTDDNIRRDDNFYGCCWLW